MKEQGIRIYGTIKEGGVAIYQTDFSGPLCLVIGGEEKGIRRLVQEQCDFKVTIPMQRQIDSLNASVAAGIIMFEIVRQKVFDCFSPISYPAIHYHDQDKSAGDIRLVIDLKRSLSCLGNLSADMDELEPRPQLTSPPLPAFADIFVITAGGKLLPKISGKYT